MIKMTITTKKQEYEDYDSDQTGLLNTERERSYDNLKYAIAVMKVELEHAYNTKDINKFSMLIEFEKDID